MLKRFEELARQQRAYPVDDLLRALLPLMREVAGLHAAGAVAALGPTDVLEAEDGSLRLAKPQGSAPRLNLDGLRRLQPHAGSALRIVGEYRVTADTGAEEQVSDLRAGDEGELDRPAFLPGYEPWEHRLEHHDELTDIFSLGLILASLACGLDFNQAEDLKRFSGARANLFRLNPSLHPVVATLIDETTALNRHERATSLSDVADRLQYYREQPTGLHLERLLSAEAEPLRRRDAVLSHMRDRLFDLSRRNRLIHFRPTQSSLNLTVASVPLVMRIESIRPDQLCTWGDRFTDALLSGASTPLDRWLRFEDQPYLGSALDQILQAARRDRAEYGFSPLRLVPAFLRWRNLKEAPDEPILSPLLWLPVEVVKKKGVRDQYVLRCNETEAEFNPALRHHLRQLYDIKLPERVNLAQTDLAAIHADLLAQIARSEPGVQLRLTDKPVIRLIHQKAVQRLRRFERNRPAGRRSSSTPRPEFSYDRDDYRPLGLAWFEKYVRPSPLPQRHAVGAPTRAQPSQMVEAADSVEAKTYVLGDEQGSRYGWEIDLTQVTLANFNYKKMSLVRDYAEMIGKDSDQPFFEQIFSNEPRPLGQSAPALDPADRWSVVASDATQDTAVAFGRSGRSFIIQGPPGTGKSQTITNLIADYVARGQRVLFVCEKRAALDVVFNRLGQAGLQDMACLIHDSQEDKKAFLLDLKQRYEAWSTGDDAIEAHAAERERTLGALDRHLARIEAFDFAMSNLSPVAGASIRSLVRRLVEMPPVTAAVDPRLREQLPTPDEWDRRRPLALQLHRMAVEALGAASFAEHPFARLSIGVAENQRGYSEVAEFIDQGERLLESLDALFEDPELLLSPSLSLSDAVLLAGTARQAVETNLADNLDLLDAGPAAAQFESERAKLAQLRERQAKAEEAAKGWRDPLSPEDAKAALDQARRLEGSLLRFLSGTWRSLNRTIGERYDLGSHAIRPKATSVLDKLVSAQAAQARTAEAADAIGRRLRTSDLEALAELRADLALRSAKPGPLRELIASARASANPVGRMAREAEAAPSLDGLASLVATHLQSADDMPLDQLAELLRDLREGLDGLPDLLPLLRVVDQAEPGVGFALRRLPLPPSELEGLVVDEALARALRADPSLKRFTAGELASSARRAAKARSMLNQANAAAIRARRHRHFLDQVKRSSLSVTQLDDGGRAFKKRYSTGRRELEHEFGKTMRHRSIRDLASDETGLVLNDLKPIWLMSPLSVSDTLPLEAGLFDVVIFDEASQIPTEEAVPALGRAPQMIIVGDEMQLPPTSFFASTRSDEEIEVTAEEEDGQSIPILLDADSLLNQAARSLPATLLAWHYRSRSEALISFSNAAFYDGRLITIPDSRPTASSAAFAPVRSDELQIGERGAEHLLGRAISFHPVADGVYQQRVNPAEARYIAGLVQSLLRGESGLSLGVVAFSEAQQTEIEAALDALAAEDSDFAARLEREYAREDEGQFNGLFVKNLENVQGDERDVIILSICYAPGPDGRMAMNFGPINQRGGEKRLNVIFSRAKRHMAVVSTISATAITNTHNDGALALRTFLAFAEAQSSGAQEHALSTLAAVNPDAERIFTRPAPADPLRRSIAEALRARGHEVREHVGSASFRCDLAIFEGDLALAILIDSGARTERDEVYERFVFRPAVLRSFGWRVFDLPSHMWMQDPQAVIAQVEAALGAQTSVEDDDPFDPEDRRAAAKPAVASAKPSAAPKPTTAVVPTGPNPAVQSTELRFQEGVSDKFWRVSVDGPEMTVTYGRVGAKGTTVIKTFASPDRARREADKLILEKQKKGYQEAG